MAKSTFLFSAAITVLVAVPASADIPIEGYWLPSRSDIAPLEKELAGRFPAMLPHYHRYYVGELIKAATVTIGNGSVTSGPVRMTRELKVFFVPVGPNETPAVRTAESETSPLLRGASCSIGPWPSSDGLDCAPGAKWN